MTSQPQVPGASAVYLFREEKTEDYLHVYSEYVRLKILNDGGKDWATVELKNLAAGDPHYTVDSVAGRTIHPDGSIVPFTGKPYKRTILKGRGVKVEATVFTLPDVTVGSIIEYRYKLRWDPAVYTLPEWIVQNSLYLRKGHFYWHPVDRVTHDDHGKLVNAVAWTPLLPRGVEVKRSGAVSDSYSYEAGGTVLELNVHDIPPPPEEEYMPPIASFGYRVMFYISSNSNPDEFWQSEGKLWSKLQDKFIGPGPAVKAAAGKLVDPSDNKGPGNQGRDNQERSLRKIYAAVEQLENTDYTRHRSRREDKAQGLSQVRTSDDIWTQQRGSSDEIAALFVAMARAVGLKAYLMAVTDRDRNIFFERYLSLDQLDDEIAVVEVDGKEQFFDPGSRYCPYGQLAWKHSDAKGLRQASGDAALAVTPPESFKQTSVNRVANLTMDAAGVVVGRVDLKFTGSAALRWRQMALTDDQDTVESEMKKHVEQMLPANMEVNLISIGNLTEYEEPLTVALQVKGPVGSPTVKRLVIPGEIFEANSKATFAREKRELAVWFPYPYSARDAVRIGIPPGFEVESLPPEGTAKVPKMAVYNLTAATDGKSVTIHRDLFLAEILYLPNEYSELRAFYSQFEAKDKEPIVLKVAAAAPAGN